VPGLKTERVNLGEGDGGGEKNRDGYRVTKIQRDGERRDGWTDKRGAGEIY
jgi:hypothetical protein